MNDYLQRVACPRCGTRGAMVESLVSAEAKCSACGQSLAAMPTVDAVKRTVCVFCGDKTMVALPGDNFAQCSNCGSVLADEERGS